MCLAVPARIIALDGTRATVEVQGNRFEADVSLVPEVTLDDYVLVHAGFAIQRYDVEDAKELLKIYEDMRDVGA